MARRTTRSGRTGRSSRSRGSSPRGGRPKLGAGDHTRPWIKVKRAPAGNVSFVVPMWVPVESLTEEERIEHAPAIHKIQQRQKQLSPALSPAPGSATVLGTDSTAAAVPPATELAPSIENTTGQSVEMSINANIASVTTTSTDTTGERPQKMQRLEAPHQFPPSL